MGSSGSSSASRTCSTSSPAWPSGPAASVSGMSGRKADMSSKFLATRELRMLLSTTDYHGFAVRLVFPGDGTPLGADYRYVSKVDFREVDWDGHEASVLEARPEPSDSGARNATTVAMYL